ncbi:MAG: nuclear transport factor 2 family protein [Thermoleophilaceae bacterium]
MGALLEHVRAYYDALNRGDAGEVASFFTDDAMHYYTRLGPHVGARAIGEHTQRAVEALEGRWAMENGVEDGEQAAIEWTMTWRDPKSGQPRIDRGTEWFRFRDGRICEVRAYHHSDERNRSGDLVGFDHAGRGHTTL